MINLLITWVIAVIAIILGYWLRSYFVKIMAGLVSIAMGIYQISILPDNWLYIISGTAVIAIGIYVMFMVAVDLVKGG